MSVSYEKPGQTTIAVFTAALLMLQTVLFGAAPRVSAQTLIETSAQAAPSVVSPGSPVKVTATVTAAENLSLLVDVEIFDSSLKRVHQFFTDHVQVSAGVPRDVSFVWNVPSTLPEGQYIVSFGVFGEGWSSMYKWHAGAATLTVKRGEGAPDIKGSSAAVPDRVKPGGTVHVDASVTSNVYTDASGTQHNYRVRAKDGATLGPWSAPVKVNTPRIPTGPFEVTFNIDTSAERSPISPYIYGTNDDLTGTENWGARRMGGNRLSTYNWENNASNAGEEYFGQSDDYIARYYGGIPWGGPTHEPGIGVAGFHEKSLQYGAFTLTTVPMAGYAAKDKDGAVHASEVAPSSRWVQVKPFKGAALSLTPDLNDDYVYVDEFVNSMVQRFGSASTPTGIKGYSLDNEPALWSTTHPLMHPQKSGAAEVLTKGIETAKAIKSVDPYAETFGPAAFGFEEMYNMYGAADWNDLRGNYSWYLDYYLDKFRIASLQENKRLLDSLDVHWYPEITSGGYRITDDKSNGTLEANKARLQAPRSLWDPSYAEDSWIGIWYSGFLPLLPKMQQSVDSYNPGTKISISEYNYGGENNVYGGIAQADVLGIFGKYGVYLATFWKMVNSLKEAPYISSAFKLFTNYDGRNSTFGDTKVKAETSDIENSSIFGSVFEGGDHKLHLIVLNKNNDFEMNATFRLTGGKTFTTAKIYAFDADSSDITLRETITGIEGDTFTYTVPKLTAAHIILSDE